MKEKSSTVDAGEIERFARIASEWWKPDGKFRPLHRMNPVRIGWIRDRITGHFGIQEEKSVFLNSITLLDIGCGGGLMAEPMARLGAKVTGIDAAQKNIAVASLHARQSGLDIDYRHMAAETLAESGAQFDVVLALEIVEHVADVDEFVAASSALLKPGGLIIYSTLSRTVKSYALAIAGAEYILRWLPAGTHDWKKFLRPHELVAALRRHEIEVTEMTGMVMHPVSQQWRLDAKDLSVNYLVAGQKP